MGRKSKSGYYCSKSAACCFALLFTALVIGFITVSALYGKARKLLQTTSVAQLNHSCNESIESSQKSWRTWEAPRLPGTLWPLNYQLELWPMMEPHKSLEVDEHYNLSGQVNITFECLQETDLIILNSAKLNYTTWNLEALNYTHTEAPEILNTWWTPQVVPSNTTYYLVLELNDTLKKGGIYMVQLWYVGHFGDFPEGLFLSHYVDKESNMTLIATQMEPLWARTVFPCFDEPALKATFDIRVVHLPNYVALSNMPEVGVSIREDESGTNWTVTSFGTTPKMSTYLVAILIADFDYINTTENGKEIRVWARKDAVKNGEAGYALNITGPLLTFFEELFDVKYPISKLDMIALPNFLGGGMENWGLVMFIETALLYDSKQLFSNKENIRSIVAHELAHQWFGNLVTMKWWNNIWLKEGFASYFEYVVYKHVHSDMEMDKAFVYNEFDNVMSTELSGFHRHLSVHDEYSDIDSLYDTITYKKGAAVVRMISSILTEKLFFKALRSFLKAYSYASVEQDDLWNHLQETLDNQTEVQLPAPLKTIMDSWTLQVGFPIVTLNTSIGQISQEMVDLQGENETTLGNSSWYIPIYWMKNETVQHLNWLSTKSSVIPEMQVSSEDEWVLINVNTTGYFKVNYDKSNWNRLQLQMSRDPNVIPVASRLQMVPDVISLVNTGQIEIETALNLTKYFDKEEEPLVWYSVLEGTKFFRNRMKSFSSFGVLKEYMLSKLTPIYYRYMNLSNRGFREMDDRNIQRAVLRIIQTTCWLGHKHCLQEMSSIFSWWMQDPVNNTIPKYLKKTVFCYGIATSTEKEWDYLWKWFLSLEPETDQMIVLSSLTCSNEVWILNRYLQYLLDSSLISWYDITHIVKLLADRDIGHPVVYDFIRENMEELKLKKNMTLPSLVHLLGDIMITARSDALIQEVEQYVNKLEEQKYMENTAKYIESIKKANIKWRKEVHERVYAWLKGAIKDSGQ
ncbi:aminopeptidase Q [Protopterus annectens]|uniref:aminopeptidase Q n=1 Tax=Protopterus annectens TaxID=7888 RepID=UPI001CFBA5D3|nr:aminopeptidase Q [Protopterus annectens]